MTLLTKKAAANKQNLQQPRCFLGAEMSEAEYRKPCRPKNSKKAETPQGHFSFSVGLM